MNGLMTVLGAFRPEAPMHFQVHEHIFVRETPAAAANPALRIDDEARSLRELQAYRAAGGAAILDAQPVGAGRDIRALARLSRSSGVHIIAVTGYHMPMFYAPDHRIFTDDEAALRECFLRELTQGEIRPGAVKAAIGKDGPTDRFAVCLAAAAAAAAKAGVPLILHTERGAGAVKAVSICEHKGLDPTRIAVCHADRQVTDYSIHEAIARTGVYLEYDTIARYRYHDDESEVRLITHMIDLGYAPRLLLSLDTTAARLKSYDAAAPGLTFIPEHFLPMLEAAGIPRTLLHRITQVNPMQLFEIE
ncbi:phosphotriesterase family protein [Butyricicoccus sp.]|uniref:phosphotriesterase family protein n=1 Tax=Butyricicoccus sp. TaxID=2049021 RepID=UPI003AACAC5F